jgi:2'-5' RNA ligase
MDRLFFALRPDADAAAHIHALAQQMREASQLRGRTLALERLHVTLIFLGQFASTEGGLSEVAAAAAKTVRAQPFELCFERMKSFTSPPGRTRRSLPLVLLTEDAAPLRSLRERLALAIASTGSFPDAVPAITPHLTLLYDPKPVAEQPVPRVGWTVREFVLVRSLVGKSEHRVLARYALN